MWWKQAVDAVRRRVERHPKPWEVRRHEILAVRLRESPKGRSRMQRDILKKAFVDVDVGGGIFHGEQLTRSGNKG